MNQLREALRKIAEMDPEGQRADDLGRAAGIARATLLLEELDVSDHAVEINRLRNVIQAACSGGLEHMIERWKVLFPDAPVPTVRAAAPMTREQATEIAIKCAKATKYAHGYLFDVDTNPKWKPHPWVVDAILEAANADAR